VIERQSHFRRNRDPLGDLVFPLLITRVWDSFRNDDTKPIMDDMHLIMKRIDHMTSGNECNVKDV